jgi:hypothetical protein
VIVEDDKPSQILSDLNLKLAEVRADCRILREFHQRTVTNIERVLKLIASSKVLDEEYVTWARTLPPAWKPECKAYIDNEISDLHNSLVYPGRVDSYSDLWIVYKHNISRCGRLWIWGSIVRCVAWLGVDADYRLTSEYTTAMRISQVLIEDIVASVHYLFGCDDNVDLRNASVWNYTADTDEHAVMRGRAGLFLILPLYTAMMSDFATEGQRTFLRGKMAFCAETLNIDQAKIGLMVRLSFSSGSKYLIKIGYSQEPFYID